MVQTITPVVHGGRRGRWARSLALHVAGATAAAAALGAVLGGLGGALGAPWGRVGGVVVASLAAAYAGRELLGIPVPVPELRRQVPEWWRTASPPGVASFLYGAGLGVGFVTHLGHGTLVAVAAAVVALGEPWLGAAVVAPFGLARSLAVASALGATSHERAGEVSAVLERLGEGRTRRLANGSVLIVLAAVALAAPPADGAGFPAAVLTGALAATFGWAALAKAARPGTWSRILAGHELPPPLRRAAAFGVPTAEAAVAAVLLAGETSVGAAMAVALLAGYSAAVVRAGRRRGNRLPCGCFGGSRERSVRWTLARNGALVVAGLAVAVAGGAVPVPRPPGPGETLPAVLVVGGMALSALLLARAAALWTRRPQPDQTG